MVNQLAPLCKSNGSQLEILQLEEEGEQLIKKSDLMIRLNSLKKTLSSSTKTKTKTKKTTNKILVMS